MEAAPKEFPLLSVGSVALAMKHISLNVPVIRLSQATVDKVVQLVSTTTTLSELNAQVCIKS